MKDKKAEEEDLTKFALCGVRDKGGKKIVKVKNCRESQRCGIGVYSRAKNDRKENMKRET